MEKELKERKRVVLPNFLIVGVARCGTTSLFHYLKQNPEIGFPKIKEPKYFSSLNIKFPQKGIGDTTVDQKIIKDFADYKQLFSELGNHKMIGEASSDYFYYHKNTIPEIKRILGDIPIIISIRNPVERSYSAYNNLVRDQREKLSFKDALKQEKRRAEQNWDWMWAYTRGSKYSEGIKAFMNNFSKVKVVLFDDIQDNPKEVLAEIEDFLGVNHFSSYETSVKYSPSGSPKNKLIRLISSRNSYFINKLRTLTMKIVPRKYLEKLSAGFFSKEQVDPKTIEHLRKHFSEDIAKTEKILGKSLTAWKK